MKTAIRGILAGTWGVFAMAGVSFFTRRMVEPTAIIGKTHYESVVEKTLEVVKPDTELDVESRIRIGELAHLGAGAFWGLAFALMLRSRSIKPIIHGLSTGTAVWLGAFVGYMPAFGISKSLATMDNYERFRTWISHVVYAMATLLAIKEMRRG